MPRVHRDGTLAHRSTPIGEECLADWAIAQEVPVRAGSVVVFSSLTPDATKRNTTDAVPKAYIVQYIPDGAVALRATRRKVRPSGRMYSVTTTAPFGSCATALASRRRPCADRHGRGAITRTRREPDPSYKARPLRLLLDRRYFVFQRL